MAVVATGTQELDVLPRPVSGLRPRLAEVLAVDRRAEVTTPLAAVQGEGVAVPGLVREGGVQGETEEEASVIRLALEVLPGEEVVAVVAEGRVRVAVAGAADVAPVPREVAPLVTEGARRRPAVPILRGGGRADGVSDEVVTLVVLLVAAGQLPLPLHVVSDRGARLRAPVARRVRSA